MDLFDLLSDIAVFFPELVTNKKFSFKTRKIIFIVFLIASLCVIGVSAYGIFLGITTKSIFLIILGIITAILSLYEVIKTVQEYKNSRKE